MIIEVTEFLVKQEHIGDNGTKFDAWTIMHTSDPLRAVLEANCMKYQGRPLGPVKEIKLEQYPQWVENHEHI